MIDSVENKNKNFAITIPPPLFPIPQTHTHVEVKWLLSYFLCNGHHSSRMYRSPCFHCKCIVHFSCVYLSVKNVQLVGSDIYITLKNTCKYKLIQFFLLRMNNHKHTCFFFSSSNHILNRREKKFSEICYLISLKTNDLSLSYVSVNIVHTKVHVYRVNGLWS